MKTTSINSTRLAGFVLGLALLATTIGAASAADQIKGGERQLNLLGIKTKAVPDANTYTPMSCAKCKDEYSKRVDWSARGINKPSVLVVKHLCAGCETTVATVGHGKAKRDVATHKCTSCGAAESSCCATAKGGSSTKGMEKKAL